MSDEWIGDSRNFAPVIIPASPEETRKLFSWAYNQEVQPDIYICSAARKKQIEDFIEKMEKSSGKP